MIRGNLLIDDPRAYAARVQSSGTIDLEKLVQHIAVWEMAAGEADIRSVLVGLINVVEELMLDGKAIQRDAQVVKQRPSTTPHVAYLQSPCRLSVTSKSTIQGLHVDYPGIAC